MSGATWALVAGGGTAGHVEPALAIGRALVARGRQPETVVYVGSRRGMEAQLVPAAGFEIVLLPGRGIERRLSLRAVAAAAALLWGVVVGVVLVWRRRPAVVVSVGGYASLPAVVGAVTARVPLVVAEQNAVPGAANRLAARFARASAVAFQDTALPRAVVTGNPVRAAVLEVDRRRDRAAAREALGLPADRFVVAAWGGSLGARRINQAVLDAVERLADRRDLAIRHVVGRRDWEALAPSLPTPSGIHYQAVEYEEQMQLLYAAADLAVCRAGGSVAELAVVGLPAVLVPLPHAPGDHQRANARALVAAGAALMVDDADLTGARLAEVIVELAAEPARVERMASAMSSCGHPDAADRVAALAEEHARG